MFPGIRDRLTNELKALVPSSVRISVIAAPERKFLVWIGGAILTRLDTFQTMWIYRRDYEETGPSACYRRNYV